MKIFLIENTKIISTIEYKKYIASIYIFSIIVSKLHHKNKLYLIILFKVNKKPKIDFYYAILFLDLSIYLRIEYG